MKNKEVFNALELHNRRRIKMNIEILLGSSVIAAMISCLISYITVRKQTNLKYITDERKEWREKIRSIAMCLHDADYKETLSVLTELKVRINGFGNNEKSSNYQEDAHIWKVIKQIEGNTLRKKELKKCQEILIEYLSLLLKMDWERSKREVYGNLYKVGSWLMFGLSELTFAVSMFICSQQGQKISEKIIIDIKNVFFILIVILFVFLINYLVFEKVPIMNKNSILYFVMYSGKFIIAGGVTYKLIETNIKACQNSNDAMLCFIVGIYLYIISIMIRVFTEIQIQGLKEKYNKTIDRISEKLVNEKSEKE